MRFQHLQKPLSDLKIFILIFLLFFFQTILYAQNISNTKKIAVSDLSVTSGISEVQAGEISTILRGELSSVLSDIAGYSVVEREQMEKLFEEQKLQLSGLIDEAEAVEIGKILSVQQLVVGSVGVLFDKIVVTIRLVNVETGEVEMASTIITDKDKLFDDLQRLAFTINTKIINSFRSITLESIHESVEKKDYINAKDSIDIYLRTNNMTPEIQEIIDQLNPYLADEYSKLADKNRRKKNYRSARFYINKALGLKLDEKYYRLRDKINLEEELEQRKQKDKLAKARLKMEYKSEKYKNSVNTDAFSHISLYFKQIETTGQYLGISSQSKLDKDLNMPDSIDFNGVEYINKFSINKNHESKIIDTVNHGYFGISASYLEEDPSNGFLGYLYLSPFLSGGFKIANFVISPGLDFGGHIEINNSIPSGYSIGLTGGSNITGDFKLVKGFGAFISLKVDYVYFPGSSDESGFQLRNSVGLVF